MYIASRNVLFTQVLHFAMKPIRVMGIEMLRQSSFGGWR